MNPISILLFVQAAAGPIIIMVALLLIAGLIGYLTAWYYAKSVYVPQIIKLEEEKADLQKQVAGLKEDVVKLNNTVDELNKKTRNLEQDKKELNKQIDGLNDEIKKLKKEISEKEKEIGSLKEKSNTK